MLNIVMTTTIVTAPPALTPTSEAVIHPPQDTILAMPKSSTSSVTHPLLSARCFHRQPRHIDEGDEFASASTAIGEGVDIATKKQHNRLVHDVGSIVRHHYPMQWESWRLVPQETKDFVIS
ncbi:hypothetical protein C1H46_009947 [Malus baccata]|uniref:Uncharacterized protein n=1 Tax=Malus baccata TaxID=106549 RepID=A0A540N046_MALBA|nr:hypothetical protein C1H46_009947 [Malus baccata]